MDIIKSCTSIEACLEAILKGIFKLIKIVVAFFFDFINYMLQSINAGSMGKYVKKIADAIDVSLDCMMASILAVFQLIADLVKAIKDTMSSIPDLCLPSWGCNSKKTRCEDGTGLNMVDPSDCGTFEEFNNMLECILKAWKIKQVPERWTRTVEHLTKCVTMTGLFGWPSPFMPVINMGECLFDFIQFMWKFLGAMIVLVFKTFEALIDGCEDATNAVCKFIFKLIQIGQTFIEEMMHIFAGGARPVITAKKTSIGQGSDEHAGPQRLAWVL
jgi:phage-related protein